MPPIPTEIEKPTIHTPEPHAEGRLRDPRRGRLICAEGPLKFEDFRHDLPTALQGTLSRYLWIVSVFSVAFGLYASVLTGVILGVVFGALALGVWRVGQTMSAKQEFELLPVVHRWWISADGIRQEHGDGAFDFTPFPALSVSNLTEAAVHLANNDGGTIVIPRRGFASDASWKEFQRVLEANVDGNQCEAGGETGVHGLASEQTAWAPETSSADRVIITGPMSVTEAESMRKTRLARVGFVARHIDKLIVLLMGAMWLVAKLLHLDALQETLQHSFQFVWLMVFSQTSLWFVIRSGMIREALSVTEWSVSSQGVGITKHRNKANYGWDTFVEAEKRPEGIYLYGKVPTAQLMLPNSGFACPADRDRCWRWVDEHICQR